MYSLSLKAKVFIWVKADALGAHGMPRGSVDKGWMDGRMDGWMDGWVGE
jgi:hypothetical protein